MLALLYKSFIRRSQAQSEAGSKLLNQNRGPASIKEYVLCVWENQFLIVLLYSYASVK